MADKVAPPHLLMTRPRAASERFVTDLESLRVPVGKVVISPAISIQFLSPGSDVAGYQAIIATSPNGLADITGAPGQTAWCVGEGTAQAAERAGFATVRVGETAEDLIPLIAAERPSGRILYLRGRNVSAEIGRRLEDAGIDVAERVVYDQPEGRPTPEAMELLGGRDAVVAPLFSARTARIVAGWTSGADAPIHAVAMSEAVAQAWGKEASVAHRPTLKAMVAAVAAALGEAAEG